MARKTITAVLKAVENARNTQMGLSREAKLLTVQIADQEETIKVTDEKINDLNTSIKDQKSRIAVTEAEKAATEKKIAQLDPDDPNNADALTSLNKELTANNTKLQEETTALAEFNDSLSTATAENSEAKTELKKLESSDTFVKVEEANKAVEVAEADYEAEIELRKSASTGGSVEQVYDTDPEAREIHCSHVETNLTALFQMESMYDAFPVYAKGIFANARSWTSGIKYADGFGSNRPGGNNLLAAYYLGKKYTGSNGDDIEAFMNEFKATDDDARKRALSVDEVKNDTLKTDTLNAAVKAVTSRYKDFTDLANTASAIKDVDMRDAAKLVSEPAYAVEMSDEFAAIPSTYMFRYYTVNADSVYNRLPGPAESDAWGTVITPINRIYTAVVRAKNDYEITKGAYDTYVKAEKDGIVDAYAQLQKDSKTFKADIETAKTEAKRALDKADDTLQNELTNLEEALTVMETAYTAPDPSAEMVGSNSYFKNASYPSGKLGTGSKPFATRWIDVTKMSPIATKTYHLVIDTSASDFGAQWFYLTPATSVAEELNEWTSAENRSFIVDYDTYVKTSGAEWDECVKFNEGYADRATVTEEYTNIIDETLSGVGETFITDRAGLIDKLGYKIPSAGVAKALTQIETIDTKAVLEAIRKAVENGKFECGIEGILEASLAKILLNLGYTITEVQDEIDYKTGKKESRIDGILSLNVKDVATIISWADSVADPATASSGNWEDGWTTKE